MHTPTATHPQGQSGQRAYAPYKGLATYNPQSGVAKGILPGCNLRSKCRCSCPAVHMTTRILLRPSSTHEPSDPPRRVHTHTHEVVFTHTSGRQNARHTPTKLNSFPLHLFPASRRKSKSCSPTNMLPVVEHHPRSNQQGDAPYCPVPEQHRYQARHTTRNRWQAPLQSRPLLDAVRTLLSIFCNPVH